MILLFLLLGRLAPSILARLHFQLLHVARAPVAGSGIISVLEHEDSSTINQSGLS